MPSTYLSSGAHERAVALHRTYLAIDPDAVILDEPTGRVMYRNHPTRSRYVPVPPTEIEAALEALHEHDKESRQ